MQEGISNEMIGKSEEDELTALVVIDDYSLKKSDARLLLSNLNNQKVLIDRESAEPVPIVKSVRVKVFLKNKPSITTTILSKFLVPLTDKTKEFFSEKNFL